MADYFRGILRGSREITLEPFYVVLYNVTMNIRFKSINGRYAFDILDEDSRIIYASDVHYFLTPHVQSSYKYAWEACRDSHKLIFQRPHHLFAARDDMTVPVIVDVSAEQMLTNHYIKIYEGLKEQARGAGKDPKERDFTFKSIKIVEGELKKILETLTDDKGKKPIRLILSRFKKLLRKYFPQEERKKEEEDAKALQSPPIAPIAPISSLHLFLKKTSQKIDIGVKKDLVENYAQKICQTIQNRHPDSYYAIATDRIKIMDKNNDCILEASVNENLKVENIIPCGSLRKVCAYHSDRFYQRYWKPIVEAIGHFTVGSSPILVISSATTLPDVPKDVNSFSIKGWNVENEEEQDLEIGFNKGTWCIRFSQIKTASVPLPALKPSKYTEQDYQEAVVKCIDPRLRSIYNRTGVVIQVLPHADIVELDVDFGRGLGNIRITEDQIEIVPV